MDFIGIAQGEQVIRGWLRVILKGDVLDVGYFASNPLKSWPDRVEAWRASMDAQGAIIPAISSTASASPGTSILGARAVVDVQVLGADQGDTYGALARRMDALISNIDVQSVQKVNNADPIARDAALVDATKDADPLGVKSLLDKLGTVASVALVVVIAYVAYRLVKEVRK